MLAEVFFCEDVSHYCVLPDQQFDVVMAIGVLHHLNDDEALNLFRLAKNVLAPSGRLITVDPCFYKAQPLDQRIVVSLDRGKHVRQRGEYTQLAANVFSSAKGHHWAGKTKSPIPFLLPFSVEIVESK